MENALLKKILIKQGDITKLAVDAIVNAANTSLLGGGGVDGAIHRAAGPELLEQCRTIGGCPVGEARITKGYNLPAKYVIHTVGPVYHAGSEEAALLRACYTNCLSQAVKNGIKSIAFPAISCGVYGYPIEEACEIALDASIGFLGENKSIEQIVFILFSDNHREIYERRLSIF
ncbi:MAG: O-acetyl-ADP-ribose deacetylase [Desulfobacteraceae bacterium]|nr:O-acetyl-ADP-ribose deacetylase [Desulfobacteraceae bacterium]